MRRSILSLALAFALVAALALSAGASASTVRVKRTFSASNEVSIATAELVFRAGRRERNGVQFRLISGRRLVVSDRAGVAAGRNCRRLSRRKALCRLGRRQASNIYSVTARLGDRDDRLRFRGDPAFFYNSTSLSGGSGNDELLGSRAEIDTFDGGSGNDRMIGGEGQAVFEEGRSANGRDTMAGERGGSFDLVDYSRRRRGVRADLVGDRDDGQAGERDKIGSDVDNVSSGRGNDVLSGNGRPNAFQAGAGADEVTGGGGIDRLVGDDGDDRITAADGGSADEVNCGRGTDTAQLDANDLFPIDCEQVTR